MQPSIVPINAGLVAIIGARGSGKTALADLIAAGAHANANQFEKPSFIMKTILLIILFFDPNETFNHFFL
jgi:type IV secretory pathway VirB4 component